MDRRVVWMVGLLAVALAGCGDDSGGEMQQQMQPSAMTGTLPQMDSGTPAQPSPMSGAAASSAPPMTPTAMPVPCGSASCAQPASLLGGAGAVPGLGALGGLLPMPMACCFDMAAGTCGVSMAAGAACELPATPDTRCPSVDLGLLAAFAGNMGFGCCTPENECGVDGATFGRGCVENGEAAADLNMQGLGDFLMVPPPRGCDDVDDAGVDDAGF